MSLFYGFTFLNTQNTHLASPSSTAQDTGPVTMGTAVGVAVMGRGRPVTATGWVSRAPSAADVGFLVDLWVPWALLIPSKSATKKATISNSGGAGSNCAEEGTFCRPPHLFYPPEPKRALTNAFFSQSPFHITALRRLKMRNAQVARSSGRARTSRDSGRRRPVAPDWVSRAWPEMGSPGCGPKSGTSKSPRIAFFSFLVRRGP